MYICQVGTSFFPILMFHFLEYFQYHPVGSLNMAMSLWIIWCGPPCLMWYASVKSLICLFINGVPLSLISLLGIPKCVMICSWMKFAMIAPVAFFKRMASAYFVKYSVAAKIHIWPLEGGFMGPIRSSPHAWKGHGVIISCSTFGWVCIASPSTWHVWHVLTNSSESFFIVGQ